MHNADRAEGDTVKLVVLVGILMTGLTMAVMLRAQTASPAAGTSLGSVTLNRTVLADGKPLEPGMYQVRLTADVPKPGLGQSPDATRYVEFLRADKVLGREAATVVSAAEVAEIAKGPRPAPGTARVELLKGNDYVRVWVSRGGMHYLIHMPPA
jgi:hypothetical protein